MISQGLASSQSLSSSHNTSKGSGQGIGGGGGGLVSQMMNGGGHLNSGPDRTQGMSLPADSGKAPTKRAAGGAQGGPAKKAPRLDIPDQGLHTGIQVCYQFTLT